ncbi:hypothetical protein [Rufibacter ruber]|uniref:hypothetical protein n=1 Tax=Rufibacter ruber TaxID=1783499 RepID=UPI00082B872B|nr:hypothetical protein [Rufibacter ruber]
MKVKLAMLRLRRKPFLACFLEISLKTGGCPFALFFVLVLFWKKQPVNGNKISGTAGAASADF